MSSQIVTKSVEIICGQERSAGTIEVTEFDSKERTRRAVKRSVICLISIAISACIPGAHFVLVPLLLVATPFLIMRAYNDASAITGMSIVCAQCQGSLSAVSTRERYPLYETCTLCHRENRIVPATATS
jgi:hypothetical protein